jgi:hypothetical protein
MVDLEKTMGSVSLEELNHRALERLDVKAARGLSTVMSSFGSHLDKK